MAQTIIRIDGMDCAGCAPPLELALRMVKGVRQAKVDYPAGTATIDHDPIQAPVSRLLMAVTGMGYAVRSI